MKHEGGALHLSATDLAGHLACQDLSQLDRLAVLGKLKPPVWRDPMLDVLRARGLAHEQAYLEYLRTEQGLDVLELEDVGISEEGFERTRTAMREGVGAIAQGTLIGGRWRGRADVLLRTDPGGRHPTRASPRGTGGPVHERPMAMRGVGAPAAVRPRRFAEATRSSQLPYRSVPRPSLPRGRRSLLAEICEARGARGPAIPGAAVWPRLDLPRDKALTR